LADLVAELNPMDDVRQAVLPVERAPFFCADIISLKAMTSPVFKLRHPLVRFVRCRTVAKVLSFGFDVRMCFSVPSGNAAGSTNLGPNASPWRL